MCSIADSLILFFKKPARYLRMRVHGARSVLQKLCVIFLFVFNTLPKHDSDRKYQLMHCTCGIYLYGGSGQPSAG